MRVLDKRRRRWAWGVVALAAAMILLATLWPIPAGMAARTPAWCVLCDDGAVADILLNLALFVPVGWGLRIIGLPLSYITIIGGALSLGIEILQIGVISGRDASLRDLLMNTIGTLVGALLATYQEALIFPDVRRSRHLVGLAGMTLLGVIGATAWLSLPSATTTREYWGQWAHTLPDTRPFRGQVLSAQMNRVEILDGRVPEEHNLTEMLEEPTISVEVRLAGGLPVQGRAQVFAVADGHKRVQLTQRDCRFGFQRRSRAADWKLRSPTVWLDDACGQGELDSMTLRGTATRTHLLLERFTAEGHRAVRLPITVGMGWRLLLPFEIPSDWHWLMTAVWIGMLTAPIGYWSVRGSPGGLGAAWAGAAVFISLAVVPTMVDLDPTGLAAWFGAVSAIGGGAAAGRFFVCPDIET